MPIVLQGLLISLLAAALSLLAYFPLRRLAIRRNILNDQDAREFRRKPEPILGGLAVYTGFFAGIFLLFSIQGTPRMLVAFLSLTLIMLIGMWDDIRSLPVAFRFNLELIVVWALMYFGQFYIDDLHGVWGIHEMSPLIAAPLSIFIGVNIIRAFNLIGGVDGYCAGIVVLSCLLFSLPLFTVGDYAPAFCLLILAGAVVPFLLNNVLGKHSQMFLGNAGTLLLGLSMTIAVFYILYSGTPHEEFEEQDFGVLAYTLAVLCIPIFDSLRMMARRLFKGESSAMQSKKLLHHLFIESGFSHVGTSVTIMLMNLVVVLIWWISWKLGATVTWQFYIVVIIGTLVTTVFPDVLLALRKKHMRRPE